MSSVDIGVTCATSKSAIPAAKLRRRPSRLATAAALIGLVSSSISPALAQQRTAPSGLSAAAMRNDAYRACQTQDEDSFRRAIADISRRAFEKGVNSLDFEALVQAEWREQGLDSVIDTQVAFAEKHIRKESSWLDLWKTLGYRKQAQQMAGALADRVYRSDAVKTAMSGLATGVGQEIGNAIELATVDAARPAQLCVQAFLGPRYGSTVAGAVVEDAGSAFAVGADKGKASAGPGGLVLNSAGGLTGVVILLIRRQLARMAQRLGQRIVGVVLGRIVSVAAGGVGIALIAKDILDLRYGMLPIIAEEMKSTGTKQKVQAEIAAVIKAQINAQMDGLADQTASQIVEIWRGFKQAHVKVLDLAERDAKFRSFVDTVGRNDLQRLDEVVGLILATEGENGVSRALRDGRLHTAMTKLDPAGLTIARDTGSLDQGLKWTSLGGDQTGEIVALGLHKLTTADGLSKSALDRLLKLENRPAKLKLASLPAPERAMLFELDVDQLNMLGRNLGPTELGTLARYMQGLTAPASRAMLQEIATKPAKMQLLAPERVRSAVVASRDQVAAVSMLLREGNALDPATIWSDIQAAIDGRISLYLIWEKHPIVVIGAGVLVLLLLLVLRGVFGGGNRRGGGPRGRPDAQKEKAPNGGAEGAVTT